MLNSLSYVLALVAMLAAFKSQNYFDPLAFIDLSSMLMLMIPSVMCLLNFSGQELKQSVQAIFRSQPQSEAILATASQLLTSLGKYQLGMLFFMWLMALIVLLPVSQGQLLTSVGHQLAIILISSIYLVFFKLCVLLPMQSILNRKRILLQSPVTL